MRRFVDLHTHSVASDGQLSPAEVVRLADRGQLAALALTDHDTVEGLAEAAAAAAEFPDLLFIPGIEVSAKFSGGTMHILGLGIDAKSPELASTCEELRAARRERNPRIIARLNELGFALTMDDVLQAAAEMAVEKGEDPSQKQVVSRPHIAEAMRRKRYVASVQDAFDRFLGDGKPAHVDKERLTPQPIIAAIRQAGGMAALAHPPLLQYANRAQFERILRELIHFGLDGLEVYHTDNDREQTRMYLDYARKFGLTAVGGSDYHGPAKPQSRIGYPRVPVAAIGEDVLRRLARQ